ncbi:MULTISPECIES: preprotein translocase subunit YajC [Streptomyces]|uniref:preprotein translocase subunit YajC n=1 Tax=Streptomyces TaxID=1883 RepID=UPI000CD49B67|nr:MULTISPECIES: preprotein translocase subunit YajC [Streptomyces]
MELLLPFILLIGVMLLMTRSAKNKQRQAMEMRDSMEPGTGVRTIGGMYGMVVEIRDEAVVLEAEDGSQLLFAKNAIGAVLEPEEYERIINGDDSEYDDEDAPVVPDDASSLTEGEKSEGEKTETADGERVELEKDDDATTEDTTTKGSTRDGENGSKS